MTLLEERVTADCPFSAAIDYAANFFAQHRRLSLVGTLALRSDVATTFDVVLDRSDASRIHQALDLDWSRRKILPLPKFWGELTVRPHGTQTDLMLAGTYEPPFGIVGALFDAVFGNAIAHRTLREFSHSSAPPSKNSFGRSPRTSADFTRVRPNTPHIGAQVVRRRDHRADSASSDVEIFQNRSIRTE